MTLQKRGHLPQMRVTLPYLHATFFRETPQNGVHPFGFPLKPKRAPSKNTNPIV